MKHINRLTAALLALVMVLSLAIGVSAVNITINDGDITGATYKAYKLLNATNAVGDDGKGTDLYSYTVNPTYRDILTNVLGLANTATDAEIVAAIEAKTDANIQTFANDVYAKVKTMDADVTAINNVFSGVDQGYYLIVETALGTTTTGASDSYSLVMLDTAGVENVTVTSKENVPSVEKTVQEKNDSTGENSWGDGADHDIGDTVNFQIVGTVSNKYAYYNEYGYQFVDEMEDGLNLVSGSVKVYIDSIAVANEVTNQFTIVETKDTADEDKPDRLNGFTAYANLKDLTGVTIDADTEVIVTYSAILNEDALKGDQGNENSVYLRYENDPYVADYPDDPQTPPPTPPGTTPEDIAIVFTFVGDVNKIDQNSKAVKGAGFTLYKWYGTETTGEWVVVGDEIRSDDGNKFAWEGLDAGKYKLVESTVPAGYNKADDLEFQVVADYDKTKDPHVLTNLTIKDKEGNVIDSGDDAQFTVTESTGIFSTSIVNVAGTELPSTGGMGTTLIYIVGGIMVLAAIVLLVTKKRVASAE